MSRFLCILVVLVSTAACQTYVPSSLDEVGPSQVVRARLASSEADRLREFRRTNSRSIEGEIVGEDVDSILLLVEVNSRLRGNRVETFHQRLQVARAGILDVELRQLDRSRTYLVVGGAAVGLVVFAVTRLVGGAGLVDNDGGPPPDDTLISVLRLPVKLGWILGR